MFRMRQTQSIFSRARILLVILGAVPGLVYAQSGSVEIVMSAVAVAGTTVTQPDGYKLPQPLIEGMVKELLERLSANAGQIDQD